MARVEQVKIDAKGDADHRAKLSKSAGDELTWQSDALGFQVRFDHTEGSPFTRTHYAPSIQMHNSGKIRDDAKPGVYRYRVTDLQPKAGPTSAPQQGDDGEVIIDP
jgi:hypothetical protein